AVAAVLRGTPRIEREHCPVVGTKASVTRQKGLRVRKGRQARQRRCGSLAKVRVQRGKIGGSGDLLPARDDLLRGHHARTPCGAQRTGRTVAPASRAAADACPESSVVTKNIEPPAPAPAALPPTVPAARTTFSRRAISGVHISRSSACWCFQLSERSAATSATSNAPELPRPDPGGAAERVVSVHAA